MRVFRQIGTRGALLCGWLWVSVVAAQEPTSPEWEAQVQAQLLDGVRAFRAEQFESALLYFRRVEQQSARPDIGMYLGMVLHKLGRHAEALAAFRSARRALVQESVADYYDAVSCYRLGLYERSRVGFAALLSPRADQGSPPLGPRLREGAERFIAAIERVAPRSPDPSHPEQATIRRLELAIKQAHDAHLIKSVDDQEWIEEAGLLLLALPAAERPPYLLRVQAVVTQIQQSLVGPAAAQRSAELTALLVRARATR